MASIYTKTGDKGETALVSGKRVPKTHDRIEAYGTVDELNSMIGLACSFLRSPATAPVKTSLELVQNQLFNFGSHLACDSAEMRAQLPPIGEEMITELENIIDKAQGELEELKEFILPGGVAAASCLHLARTICRRAERATLRIENPDDSIILSVKYLNRLSDLMFVLARYANLLSEQPDIRWKK